MTDNEANAPLAPPEPADLSGVSWPDPGPITARAVFANGKCYLLDTQPERDGPTDEKWEDLKERLWDQYQTVGYQGELFIYDRDFDAALDDVRQELARWGRPAIQPVAVAARPWEREGWCDAGGRCWWFNRAGIPEWQLASGGPYGDFSLPHHALPIPASEDS
jgi:hypothetical protein